MRKLALRDEILLQIDKAARYIGGEVNAVMKNKDDVDIRFAMAFPDVYEIGMSNLGMMILYDMFNKRDDVWCERLFSPWTDLDKIMREEHIPLFTLESQDPVKEFDFLGITLGYEMCYTNVLQLLDLSGIPLLAKERTEEDPLVIGGGACAYNPEPLAPFFDLFYIGEGEMVYGALFDAYKANQKAGGSRQDFLLKAAQIPGIYVPSLYQVTYKEDGTIESFQPKYENVPEKIEKQLIHFRNDSSLDMDKLTAALVHMGYERVGQVEMPGQFSIRGGIIDIYSLTEENPWRIELWGDEIDSIRSFDAQSQRSLENLDEIMIYPAAEQPIEKGEVTFIDYFKDGDSMLFLDELNHLEENAKAVEEEFQQSCRNRQEKGETTLSSNWMCSWEELCKKLNRRNCIGLSLLDPRKSGWKITGQFNLTVKSMNSYQSSFELLVKDLKQYKKEGYRIVLLSGSRTRAERLAKDLQDEGLSAFYGKDSDRILEPGEIMVVYGHARKGFEYPMVKFAVITETDIFGKEQKKRKKKKEGLF